MAQQLVGNFHLPDHSRLEDLLWLDVAAAKHQELPLSLAYAMENLY